MQCDYLKQLMNEKNTVSILFVCSGNIIRSPYAELLFEKMLVEKGLMKSFMLSSGAVTYRNSKISSLSRKALITEGVSQERINKFYPRYIDDYPELFRNADLILAMSEEHLDELEEFTDKSFLLTSFAGLPAKNVPDPYFESTPLIAFNMIKESLLTIVKCLTQK
ncbi:MAG: hypothetical protein ACFFD4_21555 [Candidatus Odinarchaeota archaeon]